MANQFQTGDRCAVKQWHAQIWKVYNMYSTARYDTVCAVCTDVRYVRCAQYVQYGLFSMYSMYNMFARMYVCMFVGTQYLVPSTCQASTCIRMHS